MKMDTTENRVGRLFALLRLLDEGLDDEAEKKVRDDLFEVGAQLLGETIVALVRGSEALHSIAMDLRARGGRIS